MLATRNNSLLNQLLNTETGKLSYEHVQTFHDNDCQKDRRLIGNYCPRVVLECEQNLFPILELCTGVWTSSANHAAFF